MTDSLDFVQRLVKEIPALAPILATHMDDNYGEVLPHVFMGDVSRFVLSLMARPQAHPSEAQLLRRLLVFIESEFANGSEDIQEVISTSFLENIAESVQRFDNEWNLPSALNTEVRKILATWNG